MQAVVQDQREEKITTSSWTPTAADRCDAKCPAQGYVKVFCIAGDLVFCSHHYNYVEKRMAELAYKVEDRRDLLR